MRLKFSLVDKWYLDLVCMDDYDEINDMTRDELVRAVAGLRKENRALTDNYNELENRYLFLQRKYKSFREAVNNLFILTDD